MTVTPGLDVPGGERPRQHIGHPRPAREDGPFVVGASGSFPIVSASLPPAGPPPEQRRTRSRAAVWLAFLAVLLVLAVIGLQAWQLDRLSTRLDETRQAVARSDAARDQRLTGVEAQASKAFDPEAVAAAVLPSVFRVRAGNVSGTAFVVRAPGDGGANLITNYHVVQGVWDKGGRQVDLERGDDKTAAKIVKVDKGIDVAHLQIENEVGGLRLASDEVRSGQPVAVVGAPLGLENTVTTGVISAVRAGNDDDPPAVQFDAPINPGNSGGPVVNASGAVVGIATAKVKDAEGMGFAVPIAAACDKLDAC
jgi:putative serine protease PepD